MHKYREYIKENLKCFWLGPLFMTIEAAGEFILPFLNADIINNGAANGDISYILRHGVYMVIIALVMLATGILGAYFAVRGSTRTCAGVRRDVFKKIQTLSFSDIDRFSTGSLITRVTNDITQIQSFMQSMLRGFFRSPVMLIGALIMSFVLSPSIAWVIFIVVPFLALATFLIIKTASPRYTVMQERIDAVNTGVGEAVTNIKVIKSFVREDFEKEKFGAINSALMDKSVHALKMMLLMQPVSTLAINVTTLAVVWVAGRQIMVGDMEVGTLTAFITYLSQVLTALNFLANLFLQATRAAASDKRISEVLDAVPTVSDENSSQKDHVIRGGDIEFRNVTFRYSKKSRKPALDNVSFKIKSGETVGIVGSTGSGKTTLVSLIPRLYDTDEGMVLVDGVNVRELSEERLRESVAMVPQKNTLFSGTVLENIYWGKEYAIYSEVMDACRIAQAHDFVLALPHGYQSEVGQGGGNLSGGQKQRLCIARALVRSPKILILDDATSAVDTATDAAIREGLREKMPDITKIIIAQRISSVVDADKIIVLDEGKITGIGTHDELMKTCEEYREIYTSQTDDSVDEGGEQREC